MPQVLGQKAHKAPFHLPAPRAIGSWIWHACRAVGRFVWSIPLLWWGFGFAFVSLVPVVLALGWMPGPVRFAGVAAMAFGVAAAAKDEDQRKTGLLCFLLGALALFAWAVMGTVFRFTHVSQH